MSDLTYALGDGRIAGIRFRDVEIVRRIFVSVRDRDWREIPPAWFQVTPAPDASGRLILQARHTSDQLDFEWVGRLDLRSEEGRCTLQLELEGRALRDMEVCRVGLVVLHPVLPLIGRRLVTHGPEGRQELVISDDIHSQAIDQGIPQAMTRPFARLGMELAGIGTVDFRFTGDLFELEDQRNWGDSSFKTYCTPLALGFPRKIKTGTVICQGVTLSVQDLTVPPDSEMPLPIESLDYRPELAPGLGRMAPASPRANSPAVWAQGWSHVRLDWNAKVPWSSLACEIDGISEATTVELGLTFDESVDALADFPAFLAAYRRRISAVLLRSAHAPLPSARMATGLRGLLRRLGGHPLPVLASPNGHFVEFNREKPFELDVDGIAFPFSPTVHSDDPATVVENIPAVGDMVRMARRLTDKPFVAISPLALYFPSLPAQPRVPSALVMPWLTRVVAHAASAGVTSITLSSELADRY